MRLRVLEFTRRQGNRAGEENVEEREKERKNNRKREKEQQKKIVTMITELRFVTVAGEAGKLATGSEVRY